MDSDDDLANVEIVADVEAAGPSLGGRDAPLVAPRSARPEQMLLLTGGGDSITGAAVDPSHDADAASASPQERRAAIARFLASNPSRAASIVFLGYTLHGKTSLVNKVFGASAGPGTKEDLVRGVTTQCRVHSAAVRGIAIQHSTLFTVVDTPGEPSFAADQAAGIQLATSAVVVVDSVEGLLPSVEDSIARAVEQGLCLVLVLSKIDRLVTELRLPPKDAYRHLKAIVDQVNVVVARTGRAPLSVVQGEVIFVSAKFALCLTVANVAERYASQFGVDLAALAKRLWGSVVFDPATRKFTSYSGPNRSLPPGSIPTFAAFVLEPLYKVVAQTLAGSHAFVSSTNHNTPDDALIDAVALNFGEFGGQLVDALTRHCRVASEANPTRAASLSDVWATQQGVARPSLLAYAPVHVDTGRAKLSALHTYVRVERGELREGQRVLVFNGPHAIAEATIDSIAIRTLDGIIPVQTAGAGAVVIVGGLSAAAKPGVSVLFAAEEALPSVPLAPRAVTTSAAVRVAVEPVRLQSMDTLKAALSNVVALHAACRVEVEDTGDHVLIGSSETYLDVALHDLRSRYCGAAHPIRLTDPYVSFCETVSAAPRGVLRRVEGDHGISIAMIAGPASREVAAAFDGGHLSLATPRPQLEQRLVGNFGWDELEASGLVAVGPDPHYGSSFLIDDTLTDSVGTDVVSQRRSAATSSSAIAPDALQAIANGFRAAVRRGPVCGEVVRGVKVFIVELVLPPGRLTRQTLNTLTALARQLTRAALMSAAPRLLEPFLTVHVLTRPSKVEMIREALLRRRAAIASEVRLAATPLCRLQCTVPVMDSFGLETDLRLKTDDQAVVSSTLSHWALVPGDPMDDSVALLPLQSASGAQLARDFAVKTRRRKGLPDAIEVL
jgi:U5 small nuclear ribonucleoprotein component